jgi:voltage-gated potassium channel
MAELRRRLYEILEQGPLDDRVSRWVGRALVVLIVVNLVSVVLESVPSLHARYSVTFDAIELVSLVLFTIEYAVRIWVAPEHARFRHLGATRIRLQYVLSVSGLIDLLAVAPFWIALLTGIDLRVLLVFRMVRFLKLTRYSPGMRSLLDAVYAERRALFGCLVIIVGATLVAASIMHIIESAAQPNKFGTIPDAMWWAIVTLATVGYGDAIPITPLGRVVAAIIILCGLIIVALPIGIIATACANEIHRRDFVVTWGMVARVPLFAELEAGDIADIMRLLRAQTIEPGGVIVRRGEPGHSMYLVAAGEVEIDLKPKRLRLGVGQFFGEIAVLRRLHRSATVTAVSRTSLLVLDAHDLHALMEREPRVAARIEEVARERLAALPAAEKADLAVTPQEEAEAVAPAPKRKRLRRVT